ncbi:MAG: GNAT family N-acetyltransferase [Acidimicrobiales bacterium]
MHGLVRHLVGTWAEDAVTHASALAAIEPTSGSQSHPVAGGWLVLSGAGAYVNRAFAAGCDVALSATDLQLIVSLSRAGGVVPAVEVTPATQPETVDRLRAAGFVHDTNRDVTAMATQVDDSNIGPPDDVHVGMVTSQADLLLWQETSAIGWGHTTVEARRTSDAFAAAAYANDDEWMMLAFDRAGGRPIGCAIATIRTGVATLGGMSTVPEQRRRGVQAALLRYRLDLAAGEGCDLAATTAAVGGASERNLQRHGFSPEFTIQTYTLPTPA